MLHSCFELKCSATTLQRRRLPANDYIGIGHLVVMRTQSCGFRVRFQVNPACQSDF
jgi:hypothetical protein